MKFLAAFFLCIATYRHCMMPYQHSCAGGIMDSFHRKSLRFIFLSLLTLLISNCAEEEVAFKNQAKVETELTSEQAEPPVEAMIISLPPPPVLIPPIPVAPVAPPPFFPPPPPPIFPAPEPFLNGTKTVPPEWASFVSARGQLPSRHGNKTFLYSFERHKSKHRSRHHHDD